MCNIQYKYIDKIKYTYTYTCVEFDVESEYLAYCTINTKSNE